MRHFKKLTEAEAKELGEGNRAGWSDYVAFRQPLFKKADAEQSDRPFFVRGYVTGYRLASRGKKPMCMIVEEQWVSRAQGKSHENDVPATSQ